MTPAEPARPSIVDREEWMRRRDALLRREKEHTREGDAIAAARRRLPMTEVAPLQVVGAEGPVPFVSLFGDHDELVVYKHMWHPGKPFEGQCEGCTISLWDVHDPIYLEARGVAFAVLCEGPWAEVAPFVDFMGYTHDWYSTDGIDDPALAGGGDIACFLRVGDRVFQTYETSGRGVEAIMAGMKMLDMTPYGRKETWEDSPEGWPQGPASAFWRWNGRPTAQWSRLTPDTAN